MNPVRWLASEIHKELAIKRAPKPVRKSAAQKIREDKILRKGLGGIGAFFLICVGVALVVIL